MERDKAAVIGNPQDIAQAQRNKQAGEPICKRCEGTGNELFAMYRKCSACGGSGVAQRLPTPE